MTPLTIVLFVLLFVVSYVFLRRAITGSETSPPEGTKLPPLAPNHWPVLGHMPEFSKFEGNTLPLFDRFFAQCGKIYRVSLLGTSFVLTNYPDHLRHVLTTKFGDAYEKGENFKVQFQDFLGQGIFVASGADWKMHRNVASVLFQTSELKKHSTVFKKNAVILIKRLEQLKEKPIDIQDMFLRYTLDSFSEIGFGAEVNSINKEDNQFQTAFDYVQTETDKRGNWGQYWKYLPRDKKFFSELDYMNNFTKDIIEKRKTESKGEKEQKRDLLSQIMLMKNEEGKPLYDEEGLRDFVMNFLIAGRDTTAVTLTWCFYLLSKNPEVEKKVIEEMEQVLGPSPKNNQEKSEEEPEIDWENLKKLKYLKAVLYETLRLYPPVPVDGYTALKDDVLPGGYFIPKGTNVLYSSWSLHRDPDLFEEPLSFKPERFENQQPTAYHWLPFHGGPRLCLGQEMAIQEAKIMMCVFLWRYGLRFRLQDNFEPVIKRGIILTSNNGVRMSLVTA